jgi:hypothetical protein
VILFAVTPYGIARENPATLVEIRVYLNKIGRPDRFSGGHRIHVLFGLGLLGWSVGRLTAENQTG